jgi:hypothetical protein
MCNRTGEGLRSRIADKIKIGYTILQSDNDIYSVEKRGQKFKDSYYSNYI